MLEDVVGKTDSYSWKEEGKKDPDENRKMYSGKGIPTNEERRKKDPEENNECTLEDVVGEMDSYSWKEEGKKDPEENIYARLFLFFVCVQSPWFLGELLLLK